MFANRLSVQQFCHCFAASAMLLIAGASTVNAAAPAPPDRLQVLVRETSAQLQVAYRLHPEEWQHRQEQLNAVVNAWRAAPRTDANNEQLANWLRSAIRASMPGSREALPASPAFAGAKATETRPLAKSSAPQPTPVEPKLAKSTRVTISAPKPVPHSSEADPFRDDPENE